MVRPLPRNDDRGARMAGAPRHFVSGHPLNPATSSAPGASEPSWCGRRTNVPRSATGASRRCERTQPPPAMPRSPCRLPQRVRVLTCQSWSFSRLPGDRGTMPASPSEREIVQRPEALIGKFLNGLFTKTKRSNVPEERSADCSLRRHKLFPIRSLIERHRRPHLQNNGGATRNCDPLRPERGPITIMGDVK
jgi:hypothetical protein